MLVVQRGKAGSIRATLTRDDIVLVPLRPWICLLAVNFQEEGEDNDQKHGGHGGWCLPVQGIVGIVRRNRYQDDLISILLPKSNVSKSLDTLLLEIFDIVVDIQW